VFSFQPFPKAGLPGAPIHHHSSSGLVGDRSSCAFWIVASFLPANRLHALPAVRAVTRILLPLHGAPWVNRLASAVSCRAVTDIERSGGDGPGPHGATLRGGRSAFACMEATGDVAAAARVDVHALRSTSAFSARSCPPHPKTKKKHPPPGAHRVLEVRWTSAARRCSILLRFGAGCMPHGLEFYGFLSCPLSSILPGRP